MRIFLAFVLVLFICGHSFGQSCHNAGHVTNQAYSTHNTNYGHSTATVTNYGYGNYFLPGFILPVPSAPTIVVTFSNNHYAGGGYNYGAFPVVNGYQFASPYVTQPQINVNVTTAPQPSAVYVPGSQKSKEGFWVAGKFYSVSSDN